MATINSQQRDNRNQHDRDNRDQGGGRGFAGMSEEKRREIASMGGRAAHEKGTAHEFTPEEARAAGRKSHGSGKNRGATEER